MSLARELAARWTTGQHQALGKRSTRLALLSIAIGTALMLASLSVVAGFQRAITDKLVEVVGDLHIEPYAPATGAQPPVAWATLVSSGVMEQHPDLEFAAYAALEGLVQGSLGHEGIRLKGYQNPESLAWLKSYLKPAPQNASPSAEWRSNEVAMSQKLGQQIGARAGESITLVVYREGRARYRKLRIRQLYDTGLAEHDQQTIFGDARLVQQLVGLSAGQYTGVELRLPPHQPAQEVQQAINEALPRDLKADRAAERFPEIFNWVDLQSQNVWVMLGLLFLVAVVNMATALLILIAERNRTLGVLRAVGVPARTLRGVFMWQAAALIGVGLLAGNLLGFGLLGLQASTHLLTLDAENYLVDTVPIAWPWGSFGLVNAGVFAGCVMCMAAPAAYVLRISPLRALRPE